MRRCPCLNFMRTCLAGTTWLRPSHAFITRCRKLSSRAAAILTGNYGEAGAIDYYGPRLGLPKAISGHNSYFYWGRRNYSGECVILFGDNAETTKKLFGDVQQVATITNPYAMPGEQNLPVYLCRKPSAPLAELWPHFKLII